MLRDECIEVAPTWAQESNDRERGYREIDRQLRSIAKTRAGLDVEEARWLREAERQRIWRKLGFSTALEYLEDVFGYAPRTAMDRLRVAKELGELSELESELRTGALPYSAAKELSRVMTRATEAAWLARARGKNLRDIERLVAGHQKGDDPDAPKNPALINKRRVLELPPSVDALVEQCRAVLADEMDAHVDDVMLMETLCRRFLAGSEGSASDTETRPQHRIVYMKCDTCERAVQVSRGQHVEISAAALARAECDAEIERRVSSNGKTRTKVTSTIPRPVRKLVWARDEGRCRVPGCRATRNLDVHHIIHREHGGTHDPWNLLVLCSGHHTLHHDGLLSITGRAPDELRFERDGRRLVDPRSTEERDATSTLHAIAKHSRFEDVATLEQAKAALVQLGYKRRDAGALVHEVTAHVGASASVEVLVKAVLSRSAQQTEQVAGDDVFLLAERAITQLGFTSAAARVAVAKASAHVGTAPALDELIKLALRHC